MTQDDFEFLLRTNRYNALNSEYYRDLERRDPSQAMRYALQPPPNPQQMIADIMRQSGIPNMATLFPSIRNMPKNKSAQVNRHDGVKIAGIFPVLVNQTYDMFFHVKHAKTGNSMTNVRYKITLADGSTFEGITDENGYTEKAFSNSAQIAKIEVPYHDSTINTDCQSEPCCC